jgi:hypothetical protein
MEGQTRARDVTAWLAEATGDDAGHVAAELELGERRRAFVYNELTEAGFTGRLLVDFMMRLTGLDERQARALIVARELEAGPDRIEVPQRDARLAQNEIVFRQLNEQIAHSGPHEPAPEWIDLVCECSDRGCTKRLTMPFAEYEWLRQNPWRFVVLPGHEAPAIENVVELHKPYAIVEKHGETHQQVEAADPRSEALRLGGLRTATSVADDG